MASTGHLSAVPKIRKQNTPIEATPEHRTTNVRNQILSGEHSDAFESGKHTSPFRAGASVDRTESLRVTNMIQRFKIQIPAAKLNMTSICLLSPMEKITKTWLQY